MKKTDKFSYIKILVIKNKVKGQQSGKDIYNFINVQKAKFLYV